MIDTIKLTLDKTMFWISDSSKFEKNMMNSLRGYYTMVQNPTKGELKDGIYKPRLTLSHRFNCSKRFEETLAIELSLPKLLFGNNFDELALSDYPTVTDKLENVLRQMGVMVFRSVLDRAPVSMVHYSKNIPLVDGSTPHYLIGKIKEANIELFLDTNQTDYRNEGHSFKYRANTFEVAFYDKLKDLQQAKTSSKRAIEKDNLLQLNLFDQLTKKTPLEVLRMEVRLGSRQKLRQILSKIGLDIEPTFSVVFKQEVAQKVLLHYLKEVEDNYPPLLNYQYNNPKQFFSDFLISNPKTKLSSALKYLAMRVLFEEIGVREFRQLIGRYSSSAWYGLNKEMKHLRRSEDKSIFSLLNESIINYQPLRLLDFQH